MTALYEKKTAGGAPSAPRMAPQPTSGRSLILWEAGNPRRQACLKFSRRKGSRSATRPVRRERWRRAELLPGSIIGVQLVQGDVQVTAFGTVSSVKGERALAFGHSFFGLGEVDFRSSAGASRLSFPACFSVQDIRSRRRDREDDLRLPLRILLEKGRAADLLPVDISLREERRRGC